MSDKEPYCEGGYRGCPTMKQIEELREALAFIANTAGYGASAYVDVAAKALKGEER